MQQLPLPEHKDASEDNRIPFYYSRPDLRPPRLNIITRDPGRATPGYVFTSPGFEAPYRPDSGPYIFDTNGTLIWSGLDAAGAAGASSIHDLHLCQYHSTPHLCFWRGQQRGTHGSGLGVIMNQGYETVATVSSSTAGASVDFHEFRPTQDGRSALVITYQPRFVNGTWVLDSCFEEVGINDVDARDKSSSSTTATTMSFQWCATDHIPLSSNPTLSTFQAAGKGNARTPDRAWDYVHLNSVDKSAAGDYLVSARHLDTILKISRADGSIIWRLGGDGSSFKMEQFDGFARQHDARFVDESAGNSSVTISLFNNGNDGVTLKKNPSKGLVLQLDLESMRARRVAEYGIIPPSPSLSKDGAKKKGYMSSPGFGNVQHLPNGHVLINFGPDAAVAEYTSEGGEPAWYADMSPPAPTPTPSTTPSSSSAAPLVRWKATNYHAYLYPIDSNNYTTNTASSSSSSSWTGRPLTPPALWTYARTPHNLMTFYVSWNGATEVQSYRFWIADSGAEAPTPPPLDDFRVAGTWPKQGFETNFTIGSARPWSFAEVLDGGGRSLANSSMVKTYVPAEEERQGCGKWECFPNSEGMSLGDLTPEWETSRGVEVGGGGGIDVMADLLVGRWGLFGLMEHVFALVGLAMCAWSVWGRVSRGWRDWRGYRPVEKGGSAIEI